VRLARYFSRVVCICALAACGAGAVGAQSAPLLSFRLDEGRNINSFTREGAVAAHLLLRSGEVPRILVAFPAGNGGVGLWFAKTDHAVKWTLIGAPRPITQADEKGRPLRGIEAQAEVDATMLRVDRAVLSSIRVLRDFERLHTAPDEVMAAPVVNGSQLSWARDRLDGTAGYRLTIEALGEAHVSADAITANESGATESDTPGADGRAGSARLRIKITALTGEPPLTPLDGESLLNSRATPDTRSRNVLTFLSYHEKYLAGSWRFDTYFGRDTLMSMTLLAPALHAEAIGSGVGAVLDRLAPDGEVAHEEDIGEFAVLRNMKEGRGRIDTPLYDYGMVDDDFMLAPLAARWLLDGGVARQRGAAFLAAKGVSGAKVGDSLVRNFVWVVNRTADFAADPVATKLVSIKPGRRTGNWRDSEEGLGRGIYPYDINVALVPAALEGIDRLLKSGLLDSYVSAEQRDALSRAARQHGVWVAKAAPLFEVVVDAGEARSDVSAYAAAMGVAPDTALASLRRPASAASRPAARADALTFDALSLDETGQPVPVMHSDEGFTLLFGKPTPAQLDRAVGTLTRPFPAGLMTPIGMLVANPVFAQREVQDRFSNTAYHGTVVWSWQQALMVAGLERQLARTDLTASLRSRLIDARTRLWSAINAAGELRSSELWTWSFANGCYRAEAFGARRTDVDESNAAQLWSTVFLALPQPIQKSRFPTPAVPGFDTQTLCVVRATTAP
jgi:hypothetical protein